MGGARNVGIRPWNLEKFWKVRKLITEQPDVLLKHALERYQLAGRTYRRIRAKHEKAS